MAISPQPGLLIAARYRLLRQVGAGGMGEVWAADDAQTGRVMALKLVRSSGGDDATARQALLREARAAQSLRHPHVLGIHEVLEIEGQPLLVMDLLEGETLADRLRRTPRLDVAELIAVALPIVSALGAAHAAGLVHRDLKPENVFLVARGATAPLVRVLDFGIARRSVVDAETALSTGLATTTGLVIGTPAYMSPEQLYGERDLDQRADLWSLGIVLYQCLSGTLPTEGHNLGQVIKAIVARPFEPIARLRPEVPGKLAALVERLLARDRDARPYDASEVFEVLRALAPEAATGIPAPPPLPARARSRRPPRWVRARLWTAGIGALVALGVLWTRRPAPPPVPEPVIACPPWRVLSPDEGDRWLGVAAAATACERLRVLLGGGAGLTLSPAELLGLPPRPFDRAGKSELEAPQARQAALDSARSRGAAVLDGEVAREPGRFRVTLSPSRAAGAGHAFEAPSLYLAISAALDDAEKRGAVQRARSLDPTWAEWSRARDVAGALALLDLVFAMAQNALALDIACLAVEAQAGIADEMKQVARYQCAYTRGTPAGQPRFEAKSPGQVALLVRAALHSPERIDSAQTVAGLKKLLEAEQTPLGRSTLATTLSCLVQESNMEESARFARLAVQFEPRNFLGESCAPWGQLLVTSSGTSSDAAAARAMRAWAPWDSSPWYWQVGPVDAPESVENARRAYELSPLDTNVANVLFDRLLAVGNEEEARAIAIALAAGPDPVHRLASEIMQVRLESIGARFAGGRQGALKALRAASEADSGWVRVQRLELGVRAVELAEVLGNAPEVADEVARRLITRDPPLLDETYLSVPAYIPAVCARCTSAVARRCFKRFDELTKGKLPGSMLVGTIPFANGARLWSSGDLATAASTFRPVMGQSGYVALLPLAMAQSFDAVDDEEALDMVAKNADRFASQLHGALPVHLFLAQRAARKRDRAKACALATRVASAWSSADARPPALAAARAVATRTCPRK